MSHERMRARADRVNQETDLGELLQEYGYAVVPDRQREQQFSCDLHGADVKPSARYFGTSNSTYCWVCQKKRDAIAYVMEKELLGFREAIAFLEDRLGLEPLPWNDDYQRPIRPEDEIEEVSSAPTESYEKERERLSRFLDQLTAERDLGQQLLLMFWEVFDRIDYGVARQNWGEPKGILAMKALRKRVMESLTHD